MREMKTSLENNYREHPAFTFDLPSWEVADEKIIAFTQHYKAAQEISATLDLKSVAALEGDCLQALQALFTAMEKQCADEFETRFLLELKGECIRLLDEELVWHARKRQAHFVRIVDPYVRESAIRMAADRFFFGRLSKNVVDELMRLATTDLEHFRENASVGKLARQDMSANSGAAIRSMCNVLNREFESLGVLEAVSAYTGQKTNVSALALELSVPQANWWKNAIAGLDRPPDTLYAHLDETLSHPKSIVYLSDVTEKNGATGCYPGAYEAMQLNPLQEMIGRVVGSVGSQSDSPLRDYYDKQYHQSVNSENFRRHFMRLPASLRFNSHMGWDVMPGSKLEEQMAGSERKMTGLAGTFIAFDGARLFHRGGLVEQGERVALQVVFSDKKTFSDRIVNKAKRVFS